MRWIKTEALMVCALLAMSLMGCGADPGGDFFDDGFGPDSLPIGGILNAIQTSYQALSDGQLSTARGGFLKIIGDSPNNQQASQAWAGVGWVDTRNLGTAEGFQEFETAYDLDNSNPDARVGFAGALISRGNPADIKQAISLLQGLDPGNVSFVYADRFNLGITNAEVHALLAYALRVDGQLEQSKIQKDIAESLDANVDDTTVDQILSVLNFL